jgi:hypothetical protein
MDRDKKIGIGIGIAGLILVVIGWFAFPIIKARLEGTPLPGLSNTWDFWKGQTARPIPVIGELLQSRGDGSLIKSATVLLPPV